MPQAFRDINFLTSNKVKPESIDRAQGLICPHLEDVEKEAIEEKVNPKAFIHSLILAPLRFAFYSCGNKKSVLYLKEWTIAVVEDIANEVIKSFCTKY